MCRLSQALVNAFKMSSGGLTRTPPGWIISWTNFFSYSLRLLNPCPDFCGTSSLTPLRHRKKAPVLGLPSLKKSMKVGRWLRGAFWAGGLKTSPPPVLVTAWIGCWLPPPIFTGGASSSSFQTNQDVNGFSIGNSYFHRVREMALVPLQVLQVEYIKSWKNWGSTHSSSNIHLILVHSSFLPFPDLILLYV